MSPAQPEGLPLPASGIIPGPSKNTAITPFSAYLHVPFCRVRCGYCDFNTYTAQFGQGADYGTYADSLAAEITWSRRVLESSGYPIRPLHSVFFGGGTPTMLSAQALGQCLTVLKDTYGMEPAAEITTEANPDTVDESYLQTLAAAGFNRVSFGMQSAVKSVLHTLDRSHDPSRVGQVVTWAKQAGLRVSVDLIYGTPGESIADWRCSVDTALSYQPDHISAYSLIIEPGTKMFNQVQRGQLPTPSEDDQATKYEIVDAALAEAGYGWYEISNWAHLEAGESLTDTVQFRQASSHNLAYWHNYDWWGFGPGAHSHFNGTRWWNVKHPGAYAQRLQQGVSPSAGSEQVGESARLLEQVMLGIRTRQGLALADLPIQTEDGASLADRVQELAQLGYLEPRQLDLGRLVLTLSGRLMADYVTGRLL